MPNPLSTHRPRRAKTTRCQPGRITAGFAAALLAATLIGAPGIADTLQEDADALESCMSTAWPRDVVSLCVGILSDPCQEAEGETPQGMSRCLGREADAWDTVLNRQWPELMTRAREVDAAIETERPTLDTAAATLQAAQRAWAVYRDSECRYAHASWGGGSFRTTAHAACRLDLTARRVMDFHARLVTGK